MKFCIVLCFVVAIGCAGANLLTDVMAAEWQTYKADYGKDYDSHREDLARFMIYSENKLKIAEHNKKFAEGKVTYEMGLNEFSDWTFEEFAEKRLMRNDSLNFQLNDNANDFMEDYMAPENFNLPYSVDWREKGAVTEVKDQGECGSCWAFAATGTIEGQWYLKKRKLVSLSEQNLLDCSGGSCDGYNEVLALQYVIRNKGIDTEESYSYKDRKEQCTYNRRNIGATISKFGLVHTEKDLLSAVATVGPVAISMLVDDDFRHYKSGIYYSTKCTDPNRGHALLAVGYSIHGNNGYWIVKNSWALSWGTKGFGKLRMGYNVCEVGRRGCSYAIV